MFGYVIPPTETLAQEERDRFRRTYCGLCHALSERYGERARLILNFDFAFLAILLSDGEEGEARSARCYASPLHGRAYRVSDAALTLAADESVILAYRKLDDDVHDDGALTRRAAALALRSAYREAARRRPQFDEAVERQLCALRELEERREPSLDLPADTFATLLAAAAEETDGSVKRRVLSQILYHLGRWIYLVDAADDLKRDAAQGAYNPVALRYGLEGGVWTAESREAFAATLDHSVHMIATAFELWDFGVWTPLLRETFYGGLFAVGHAVLDGTFRSRRFHKTEKQEEGR
ncbi:MAG: hypothetical protein IKN53_01910 [Oscillibacter sp.]|nr:hypothetical protein [Oscillibacter sp.]